MKNNNAVTVIGVGLMGPGIATCAALAGHPTILVHASKENTQRGMTRAKENIDQLLQPQLVGKAQARNAKTLLRVETDIARSLEGIFLVIEAITEDLSAKQELFGILDQLAEPELLLTSTTSGLRITDIARDIEHPERVATAHFWFPGHLVPLVEIVMGDKTEKN